MSIQQDRINKLEAEIDRLRKENARLREKLSDRSNENSYLSESLYHMKEIERLNNGGW